MDLIRSFRDGDAEAIAATFFRAVRELGLRHYNPAQVLAWAPILPDLAEVRARAQDGRLCLVAEANGRVVCYGDLEANGHIDHLFCRPEASGTGLAGTLLEQLLGAAKNQAVSRVFVEASAGAQGLFMRKGFTNVERHDFMLRGVPVFHYRMDKVL